MESLGLLSEYETTVVMRPDIGGEIIESTLDRVRNTLSSGGKLLAINHWGKKRLAYEIERHTRGVYVHAHYLGASDTVAEIERNLRLSENVLRFLTVRLADGIVPETREVVEYVQPEYDAADDLADEENEPEMFEAGSDDDGRDGGGRGRGERGDDSDDDDDDKDVE